jgi:hypothetical protein
MGWKSIEADKLRVSPSGHSVDKTAKNGLLDVKHSAGYGAADVSGARGQGRLLMGLGCGQAGDKTSENWLSWFPQVNIIANSIYFP